MIFLQRKKESSVDYFRQESLAHSKFINKISKYINVEIDKIAEDKLERSKQMLYFGDIMMLDSLYDKINSFTRRLTSTLQRQNTS